MTRPLKALDLYSGVGGWSLGLAMAGIDVVASYEIWDAANKTNSLNNRHAAYSCDVRSLMPEISETIDLVVGSPPCTQFSYANRGGSGDVTQGLADIAAFFRIVSVTKPVFWVLENVPRAIKLIEAAIEPGGCLYEYKDLVREMHVFHLEDFGIPQRRRRCLVGNIEFELLKSYSASCSRRDLAAVMKGLEESSSDPMYSRPPSVLGVTDNDKEDFLSPEEFRINSSNKILHPIYNSIKFPEPSNRPVRTITALCTRVSRESIIVEDARSVGRVRRLTLRERASLQSFPVDFQFYGQTYRDKLRMIGNAMPPLFAFYIGHSCLGTAPNHLPAPEQAFCRFEPPLEKPPVTSPERLSQCFRANRSFRFAIPSLHLKSGVRFELANSFISSETWQIALYYGSSKRIGKIIPHNAGSILACFPADLRQKLVRLMSSLESFIFQADIGNMQACWSRRGTGLTHPLVLLDRLDQEVKTTWALLIGFSFSCTMAVERAIAGTINCGDNPLPSSKLQRNAPLVAAGLLVAATANVCMGRAQRKYQSEALATLHTETPACA